MALIRDITKADYSVVAELLAANGLGDGWGYEPEGLTSLSPSSTKPLLEWPSSSSTATSDTMKAGKHTQESRRSF